METAMESIWSAVATHLWQTSWILAALGLLAWALRRAPARLGERVGWLGILKLLLPVGALGAVSLPWLAGLLSGRLGSPGVLSVRVLRRVWDVPALVGSSGGGEAHWGVILTGAWLLGAGVVVARTVRDAARARPGSITPASGATPAIRDAILQAAARAGIDPAGIGIAPDRVMPHVAGLIAPRIVVPASLVGSLSAEELAGLLLHEDAHRLRREPLRILVLRAVLAAFFFFPPLWLLVRFLAHSAEIACDERALEGPIDPESYTRALSKTVRHGLAPVPAACADGREGRSPFARRLDRIARHGGFMTMNRHRLAVAAAAIVALAGVLVTAPRAGSVSARTSASTPDAAVVGEIGKLRRAGQRVHLSFQATAVGTVLDTLAEASGLRVVWTIGNRDTVIDIQADGTLEDALLALSAEAFLTYRVPDADTLEVEGPFVAGQEGMEPPRLVERVEPVYPQEHRDDGTGGRVILEALILEDGTIGSLSSVNASDDLFKNAAIDAVRRWRYEPARLHGRPVRCLMYVKLTFDVRTGPPAAPEGGRDTPSAP